MKYRRRSWLARIVMAYLLLVGLMSHAVILVVGAYVLHEFQVTPRQAVVRGMEELGLEWPWLSALLAPRPVHQDHIFDGRLRPSYPRILLPELANWSGAGVPDIIARREQGYQARGIEPLGDCQDASLLGSLGCYLSTGDPEAAARLLSAAQRFEITTPNATGNFGNTWQLALAYDGLRRYPALSDTHRQDIEARIIDGLERTLLLLDSPSPSLWHGRTNLACSAWLSAIVLNPDDAYQRELMTRSQGHFLDIMDALELTEGWPEGYNYWAQSRGFLLALAGSAYLNGLEETRQRERIQRILRRTGFWHVYATRPDNRAEGFGDEGLQVDLKNETRRIVDLLAQATRSQVLATFSRYLEQLHGAESYHPDYRWGFRLFNDPSLVPLDGEGMDAFRDLPRAELFGRDALNLAYLRSDWSPQATFVSLRAGHSFTHHGHYDAGHFSLFKGAPLAVNASAYGRGFFARNRLHYGIRSVAKNTLLILRPDEQVRPNRQFTENIADGGQRLVLPTGSAIRNVNQWYSNLGAGQHLEGATLRQFEHQAQAYSYFAADLTGAYNNTNHDSGGWGGKVSQVERELFYLRQQDRLLVYDRVHSTAPEYRQKWLLHTVNRPTVAGARVLVGDTDNGILQSDASEALVSNPPGHLLVQRILPGDGILRLVGGPDYRYYVETDGDDSDLDGENMDDGAVSAPWFDNPNWRLEVQSASPRENVNFLMVLTPRLDAPPQTRAVPLASVDGPLAGVKVDDEAVLFVSANQAGTVSPFLPGGIRQLWLVGLPGLAQVQLRGETVSADAQASSAGVVALALMPSASERAVISWR